MNSKEISTKLITLISKFLSMEKMFYKYFFHTNLILFFDDFNKLQINKKNYDNKQTLWFIIARIFSHIDAKLIDPNIIPTIVSHFFADFDFT